MVGIIIIIIVAVLVIMVAGLYNGIVGARNRCDNAWQTIDAQLQRRTDLIPNLVETVKGYAAHEKGTLEAVTQARAGVAAANTPEEKMAADNVLTGALRQLFAVAEAYPDLKANANFQQLQSDLTDTENKIVYARQSFNDCVLNYNNAIQTFPGNLVAGFGHFEPKQGFQVTEESARQAPKVDFGATAPAPAAAPAATAAPAAAPTQPTEPPTQQ
jgi:LemA protein